MSYINAAYLPDGMTSLIPNKMSVAEAYLLYDRILLAQNTLDFFTPMRASEVLEDTTSSDAPADQRKSLRNDVPGSSTDCDDVVAKGSSHTVDAGHQTKEPNEPTNEVPGSSPDHDDVLDEDVGGTSQTVDAGNQTKEGIDIPGSSPDDIGDDVRDTKCQTKGANKRPAQDAITAELRKKKRST
jgi:hypothetical protein